MTAPTQILMAGAGDLQSGVANVADTKAGAQALGTFQLAPGGTIMLNGNGSWAIPTSWWTGFGTLPNYWASITVSGSAPTGGSGLGIVAVGTGPFWQWNTSVAGPQTLSATATVKIWADAAGTQQVAQWAVSVNVQRTS